MRVLIAYASKMGGTAGVAEMVRRALLVEHLDAEVRPAANAGPLDGYDAVIVGSALYAGRWRRPARRFVRRNQAALRHVPVWFFSSGPLDDSATAGDIAPTKQVADLMARVGARGHVTFGGCLPADAKGFPASAMAKTKAGDWRDPQHITTWAIRVGEELMAERHAASTA